MIARMSPAWWMRERGYPPLGLLYVASFLEKNISCEVEILDTILDAMDYEQIEEEIRRRKPDIVGIQAMTFTLIDATLTAKVVKKVDPSIPVIFGGPHVYIYPYETLQIPEVDYIVVGEGEETTAALIQAILEDRDPGLVNGIGYRDSQQRSNYPWFP